MKKVVRLTENDLHRMVKESVNRILNEDQEGYNQVMRVLDNPTVQKGLKKAWKRTLKRNPNADYDSFEYHYALNLLNKKREEDELYGIVKESVNRVLREFRGDGFDKYFNDALEALEMSDGMIDFDEWYPAFQDELDEQKAWDIFYEAQRAYNG